MEGPPKPFDSGVKELERDFPWLNKETLFNPKMFDLMGEPMINISLSESQSMPSEFSANHCSLTSRHPIFLRLTSHDPTEGIPANYGEIVVPGAGLNGLRLLPDVWRKNYETVCSYETVRPVTVLMNDLNSFVAEVWETVAKRGALPEGYTAVKFVQGSLGKDEYLNQIHILKQKPEIAFPKMFFKK